MNKKPRQIRAYLSLAWYAFRAMTRNPSTFAFGFLFPVVFISIFGIIGNSTTSLSVGIPNGSINNPITKSLVSQSFIAAKKDTLQNLEQQLRTGKINGILEVSQTPTGRYNVTVLTSTANPQASSTLSVVVKDTINQANLELSHISNPPVTFSQQQVAGREFRYIDFALPGQIGFSLLSTAIFGTVFGLIFLKKALVLKRMFATPTKPLTVLLAQGTSRLIMAIMQTVLIIGIGVLVFKFYLPQGIFTFLELLLISAFGLVAFLGFGFFFAGLANDENSAGPLVNLITLPQFLLSGTFFPTDSLPGWVQPIANNLPLSYLNIAIRNITIEGLPFSSTLPYLLGLALWSLAMYLLAARTFKWE